jgi:hypothetical protein|tara:strand:+ start:278 stop:496 length:219 start_codon:yes stop_codon:yes gene_type:complete
MIKIDKEAMGEALNDVSIGLVMSFPISFGILSLCQYLELSLVVTSLMQVMVFTFVAIVRKYMVRVYYKKREQ